MSDQKKQNYIMSVLVLKNWDRLLGIEVDKVRVLIKNYAHEKYGIMAEKSFDTLCAYLSICNEMKILVNMFMEDIPSDGLKMKLTDVEYLAFKTVAKSVEAYRLKLKEFNIVMEPI